MGKGCDDVTDQYETKAQTSARNRSLWIVHLGMTIFSMGFSIVLTGVYPYMKQASLSAVASNRVLQY